MPFMRAQVQDAVVCKTSNDERESLETSGCSES